MVTASLLPIEPIIMGSKCSCERYSPVMANQLETHKKRHLETNNNDGPPELHGLITPEHSTKYIYVIESCLQYMNYSTNYKKLMNYSTLIYPFALCKCKD